MGNVDSRSPAICYVHSSVFDTRCRTQNVEPQSKYDKFRHGIHWGKNRGRALVIESGAGKTKSRMKIEKESLMYVMGVLPTRTPVRIRSEPLSTPTPTLCPNFRATFTFHSIPTHPSLIFPHFYTICSRSRILN